MGRVIRGVEVDRDLLGAPMEPLPMAVDHGRGQFPAHGVEHARADTVSNREIVGCEASGAPSTGSRPSSSL